jgi:hypothetical protein
MKAAGGPTGTLGKSRGLKADPNAMVKAQTNQRLRARAATRAADATTAANPIGRASSKLRPGELINANARPLNTMAKPAKSGDAWSRTKANNLEIASSIAKSKGFRPFVDTRRKAEGVAAFSAFYPDKIKFVKNSTFWSNPKKNAIDQRRQGWISSSNPRAVVMHEIGHSRAKRSGFMNDPSKAWGIGTRPFDNSKNQRLARRVSGYAATSPSEFVAETYAGLRTGRRYDYQVMQAYRQEAGFSARPAARRRSRLPKR